VVGTCIQILGEFAELQRLIIVVIDAEVAKLFDDGEVASTNKAEDCFLAYTDVISIMPLLFDFLVD